MTFSNAIHYAWGRSKNDETRRLLLLQNAAAFLPLYRGNPSDKPDAIRIDTLEPVPTKAAAGSEEAVTEIFANLRQNRQMAAQKILGYLEKNPDPKSFANAARRLIFLKGNNAHDYKFSSAVLEDHAHLSPAWRNRLLAASAFNFRGSAEKDNDLVQRTRSALGA